jgi:hypothetical protein
MNRSYTAAAFEFKRLLGQQFKSDAVKALPYSIGSNDGDIYIELQTTTTNGVCLSPEMASTLILSSLK